MWNGNPSLYNRHLFSVRTYGSLPRSYARDGLFSCPDDYIDHWNGRASNCMDLLGVPEEPFAGCIVHFLSGIVDSYNSHAACLLLVCKKESVQEIKIRIQAQIRNPGNETTKYNCKKREK